MEKKIKNAQNQKNHQKNPKLIKRMVPKADLNLDERQKRTFASISGNQSKISFKPSKDFKDVPVKDYSKLFLNKCQQCNQLCDFSFTDKTTQSLINSKSNLLKQISGAFAIPAFVKVLTPELMGSFYATIAVNVFRPRPKIPLLSPFMQDVYFDLAWPHISLCYDALKNSLNSPLAQQMPSSFLFKLIENSTYPDYRERVVVRDILHSIYMKFVPIREKMRKFVAGHFCCGRCSTEILEFFTSIVMGFAVPLNTIHISYFHQTILPLFTIENVPSFSTALTTCVIHYIEKENSLLPPLIDFLILHWPKANVKKIPVFLFIFQDILISSTCQNLLMNYTALKKYIISIFQIFGKYCSDGSCEIANTVLGILVNNEISGIVKTFTKDIFEILIHPLMRCTKKHWDESVRENSHLALEFLFDIDPEIFNEVAVEKSSDSNQKNSFLSKWTKVMEMAKRSDRNIKQLNINFTNV